MGTKIAQGILGLVEITIISIMIICTFAAVYLGYLIDWRYHKIES